MQGKPVIKSFTDVFIRRPVISVVICLLMILFGLISYSRLPVRQYPKIDSSVITITTNYPGADALTMADTVTTPLSNAIANVEGIDYVTAKSTYSQSVITVNLKLGHDINDALSDINSQVSSTLWELPENINNPIISKDDPNATPVYYFAFNSKSLEPVTMGNYLTTTIKPILETVPGVGQISVFGDNKLAMRIWLDPNLMTAQDVTAEDVSNAIKRENVQAAAGKIDGQYQQYQILTNTDLHTANQFNQLIVRADNNQITRIKDIGRAELGPQSINTFSVYVNGRPGVGMAIIPKSDANPLVVAKGIQEILPTVHSILLPGMNMVLQYNVSSFISASLAEVVRTMIEAAIIVMLVVFLILGSLRTVIIPLVTIPLSLISVCSILLILGYSLNTLTLLAAVLAIGLVVDDAIVVAENCHRHIEMGKSPFQAAIDGAREIRFAIIAMTMTLASAYVPIALVTGLTGILFREFAVTLAYTVIISGVIALVLSPMMCAKFMVASSSDNRFERIVNAISDKTAHYYMKVVHLLIKIRWVVLAIAIVIYIVGALAFLGLHSTLAPPEDQGYLMAIQKGPALANLNYTEKHSQEVADIFRRSPEVIQDMVVNGYPYGINSSFAIAILKPWSERRGMNQSAFSLLMKWFPQVYEIPGVESYIVNPPTLPGSTPFTNIEYVLKTAENYIYLSNYIQKFMAKAQQASVLMNMDTDLKEDMPHISIDVNRNLASELGVTMQSVAQTLATYLGEPITTRFTMDNQNYEVIPQLYPQYRQKPSDLQDLYVRSNSGELVPLSTLVNIHQVTSLRELNSFQQLNSATISGILPPGTTIGDAYHKLNEIAKETLPKNIQTDSAGQLRQYVEAQGKMAMIFIFAIIFIYLILVAQFENFIDPFVVMLSVPLSLTGALLALRLLDVSLNIYTEISLVSLLGLMSKQAILIVDFANQQQRRGVEFTGAIINASAERLRPIIMTSIAMILGAMPLITGIMKGGAGSISRFVIGLVIVAGLTFGTFCTIFIIPVQYHFMSRRKKADPHLTEAGAK